MNKVVKFLPVFIAAGVFFCLTGCARQQRADYSAKSAEFSLNSGKNLKNKTIRFKIKKLIPNSAFGYNMETGKHLNFVSDENPNVKKGDTVIVKVDNVKSILGSYVIEYSDLKKQ